MKSRLLGNTGARVSAIGLGAMPLAIDGRPDWADAVRVVHAALDAGISWIDTANAYCRDQTEVGYGERLVASALREWGGAHAEIRIATKGGLVRPAGAWKTDGRPDRLKQACEQSLKALGVSAIFLYQLHAPDPHVPFAESVGALVDLRRQGKIEHIGLSNVDATQIREALALTPIASVQNRCSPFEREALANGVLDACERSGMALIAYSPVGGHGGHVRTGADPTLVAIAARRGCSPHQVALAWLLGQSPAVLPIPGASRPASAVSSAQAADVELTHDDRAELEAAFPRGSSTASPLAVVKREARARARRLKAGAVWGLRRWLGRG